MNPKEIISKFHLPNPKWLMEALAASVEGLLHHTFGERYTGTLLSGLLVAAVVEMLSSIVPRDTRVDLMPVVAVALFARLIAHWVSVGRRQRAGIHIDSRSSGSPWGFWSRLRIPVSVTTILLEPLLCIAVALLASPFDQVFFLWLCCAGLALMAKNLTERFEAHDRMLDVLDARMAARNLRANVNQQMNQPTPVQAAPVTLNAPTANPQPAHTNPNHFRNLDPALQRLIHEDAPAGTPNAQTPTPTNVRVTEQQAARVAGQTAATGRIHVRPARASASTTPTQASVTSEKPKVVIVRTRPAPPAPLRVSPSGPKETPANSKSIETSRETTGTQKATPATPPSNTASPANTTAVGESAHREHAGEEHDILHQRIQEQAEESGFEVKSDTSNGAVSPIPDLLLAKGDISLGVEIVPNHTTLEHEFERVRKCLASGLNRVAVVCANPEQLKALAGSVHAGLAIEEAMKVGYFTPEELTDEILRLANKSKCAFERKRRP